MGRKKPETAKSRLEKQLIESYDIKTAQDIQAALKDLLGETIESMLKEELDEHLDYKYGQTPISINIRNGSSKKTVKSSINKFLIRIQFNSTHFYIKKGALKKQVTLTCL